MSSSKQGSDLGTEANNQAGAGDGDIGADYNRLKEIEGILLNYRTQLGKAAKLFAALSEADDGRVGCMAALAATVDLCCNLSFERQDISHLERVITAFENAEQGSSDPLLAIRRRKGRPPVAMIDLQQRGLISAAAEALIRSGLNVDDACRWIARRAVKLQAAKGVSRADLWDAIQKWREHAAGEDPEAWDNVAFRISCEQMTLQDKIGAPAAERLLKQAAALERNPI